MILRGRFQKASCQILVLGFLSAKLAAALYPTSIRPKADQSSIAFDRKIKSELSSWLIGYRARDGELELDLIDVL